MSLTGFLVPTFRQMLLRLSDWLTKAEAQEPGGAEALLSARLAPDMFPLSTQVRFACVQVREAICRLEGKEFPEAIAVLLEEGRDGGENPGSIAEAQARIAQTINMLDGLKANALDIPAEHAIAHELPSGMIFDLTAEQYVRDWALPQFYFHVMAAYAILRGEGIALGKADYVAHMFGYLRPGTMRTTG